MFLLRIVYPLFVFLHCFWRLAELYSGLSLINQPSTRVACSGLKIEGLERQPEGMRVNCIGGEVYQFDRGKRMDYD